MGDIKEKLEKLSEEQRELLRKQLLKKKQEEMSLKGAAQAEIAACFPLSLSQERLWALNRQYGGGETGNVCTVIKLTGPLQTGVLEKALNEAVKRHEVLRANIRSTEGRPAHVISEARKVSMETASMAELLENQREEGVRRYMQEELNRPFNLENDTLFRVKLLQISEKEHFLLCTLPCIIFDEWSGGVLVNELAASYKAICSGNAPQLSGIPVQYRSFVQWQKQTQKNSSEQLEGMPVTRIPADREPEVGECVSGATQAFTLSEALTKGMRELSRRQETTLFTTLLAAFNVLLHKCTGLEDVSAGSPIANRGRLELEGVLGLLENMSLMRTDLSGNPTFREVVARTGKVVLDAYENQAVPYTGTDAVRNVFVLKNKASAVNAGDVTFAAPDMDRGTLGYDLIFTLGEAEQGISGRIVYNSGLFEEAAVDRMAGYYANILRETVKNPEIRLSELTANIEFTNAETNVEKSLVEIWKEVLDCDHVGIHDNFFEIGGNSLLLVRMHEKLEERYPGKITIAKLFSYPTVSKLSRFIEDGLESEDAKITLTFLPLPSGYFVEEDEDNEDTALKFKIDDEVYDRLFTISEENEIEISDSLMAIYIYLLGEVSETKNITLQTMVDDDSRVYPLNIDLSDIDDFIALMKTVRQKRLDAGSQDTYPLQIVEAMELEKEDNSVWPMFICGGDPDDELLDGYDIVAKADVRSSSVSFIFEYDASRLKKDKIEELAYNYKKLIEIITERMI